MGKADLHIHSIYSHDSTSSLEVILEQAANHAGLDLIAITDHNRIEGALRAVNLAPQFGIDVIPGIEVSTRHGHLLALFVHEPIERGLSAAETIEKVADQGGICIPAHPLNNTVSSFKAKTIFEILDAPDLSQIMVGIETINAGLLLGASNSGAKKLCDQIGLASVGSSDSHVSWSIGSGFTTFPGFNKHDLKQALLDRTTEAFFGVRGKSPQFFLSHGYHIMLRKIGLAVWTPSPGSPYQLKPLSEVYNIEMKSSAVEVL
jgi:predicted metal-dependent phosphoesterase TrpH